MSTPGGAQQVTLVRHGATEWSRARRHTGRTDVPLDEDGRRQAEKAGVRLGGLHFDRVLTSPLSRAADTCRLAGLDDCQPCDDLLEWDYGAYEGRTTADIRAERPGWLLWRDGAPGGEQAADVGRRVDRVIASLRAQPGDAVLFAHAHVLRVLAARWIGLAPAGGSCLVLDPASLSVLGYEREVPVIRRWNEPP